MAKKKKQTRIMVQSKSNLYRLTFGGCSPFDITGNLADGGRFNIGGATGCNCFKIFQTTEGSMYLLSLKSNYCKVRNTVCSKCREVSP